MNAKEYLQQYAELKDEVFNKQAQIDELEQLNIKNPQIIDLQHTLKDDLTRLLDTLTEITGKIYKIPNSKLRLLLIKRYISGDTWGKISADMNYSYVHVVHRLHPQALEELEKIL